MSKGKLNRSDRWFKLRRKIRAQILETKSSLRLSTLVKRLNVVNRDNRNCNRAVGSPLPEHVDLTVSEIIARLKKE